MIIGINTLFMIPNQVGGTEYYLRSFLDELSSINSDHSFVVFCNRENFSTFSFKNRKWKIVLCPISATNRPTRILYEQLLLPQMVMQYGCDVLHSFGYVGPVLGSFKKVVTIHDANWRDHPEDTSVVQNMVTNILMQGLLRSVNKVVTDSEYAKERLIYHFPRIIERISVILPGIEKKLLTLLNKKLPHPVAKKRYFLCVSGLYPHKKVPYLLKLWKKQRDCLLVLVGKNGSDEHIVKLLSKQDQDVIYFPKVSLGALAALYQHASAFIFPSVYEGFGFPVYEALAANLPVLVGKKDLYHSSVQPYLTELTFDISKDTKLLSKFHPEQKSLQLASILNYTDSAKKLLELYESLQAK